VKDLYNKNCKTLQKEIEEDIRRWQDFPCLWISRINVELQKKDTCIPRFIAALFTISKPSCPTTNE
jgi:ribosomal protein L20